MRLNLRLGLGIGSSIRRYLASLFNGYTLGAGTITGGGPVVADYQGTLVKSPVDAIAAEGLRLATTVSAGALLGPELVENPNFVTQSSTGWAGTGVEPFSFTDGVSDTFALVVTAADGVSDRAEYNISGLNVGTTYRCVVRAKQGDGVNQQITAWTFGTISATPISGTVYQDYIFDVVATSTSGLARIYAAVSSGSAGDSAVVDSFSIREVIPTWVNDDGAGSPIFAEQTVSTRTGTGNIITDPAYKGCLIEEARTNLFEAPGAPATQDITTSAQKYAISVLGSGSVTLSGTATGTVNAGEELVVTATAGTLTVTVTDTPDHVQVEAGAFVTSPIGYGETDATTHTRTASNLTYPSEGRLRAQNCAVWLRNNPIAAGQENYLLSSYTDANNELSVVTDADTLILRKRLSGADNDASTSYTHAAGELFDVRGAWTDQGLLIQTRVYSGGSWGDWSAFGTDTNATDAIIAATIQAGARNNADHFNANLPFFLTAFLPARSSLAEYQALIEDDNTIWRGVGA